MQTVEFKVVAVELEDDMAQVRMHAKVHQTFTSIIFLKVPVEQLSEFSIGQIYSLTAQAEAIEPISVVETVPLGANKTVRFEDGSPVEEAPESAIERRGGYRL